MLVSEVLIMPVEYSEVTTSAPSTMMISCPKSSPNRLMLAACALISAVTWAAIAFATAGGAPAKRPSPLLTRIRCSVLPQLNRAPMPTQTTTSANSVQYVDRTDRILVNSELSVPKNPARPDGRDETAPP